MTVTLHPETLADEPGVSLRLAQHRAARLTHVEYALTLVVPGDRAALISGRLVARFTLDVPGVVIFDFAPTAGEVRATRVNGEQASPQVSGEHIVVAETLTRAGNNEVEFDFTTDGSALNRQSDFLYSLLVPARARRVFPCFDQPDLKAHFQLSLDIPAQWQAVSNTPVEADASWDGRRQLRFAPTEPLPTYLFAFVAGVLHVDQGQRRGRTFRIWHREDDLDLVTANRETILDLHDSALAWLESYTGIAYPFRQFDVVLVPSFQFSGMEHPGAILYNASRLLLRPSASGHEHLTRASLIAHETAHMWFGDLVTMRWFDDVWIKEVFANFVAEKVVADLYPNQNHELRFYLANYSSAYAVDRTGGSHPIRQHLANLSEAGQLYGPIIYLKAPIVFRQLEHVLGEERFRDGVRRFLAAHRFGNADWDDLQGALAGADDGDLRRRSAAWLDEPGRPRVEIAVEVDAAAGVAAITSETSDPARTGRFWPQRIAVALGYPDRIEHVVMELDAARVTTAHTGERPAYVLGGGRGLGYGYFPLDESSRAWLLGHAAEIPDPLTRAVAWMSLWEELLEGDIDARHWCEAALRALEFEDDEQNIERLLSILARAFWLFLPSPAREAVAPAVEACLRSRLSNARVATERATWFGALRQVVTTPDGCAWLERVWARNEAVEGLSLGEVDETTLALELAVRSVPRWGDVLERQRRRIRDSERRDRFEFIAPAAAGDAAVRTAAFERFADPALRTREEWVLRAMHYLNHPLRQSHARQFIRPGLDLLPDIQRTGDIFFPARWADAMLAGHASPVAAAIVDQFLVDRVDLAPRLRNAVVAAADLLFRVSRGPD